MSKIINVTDSSFDNINKSSSLSVLIYFWSDTCTPCKVFAPILEAISEEYVTKIQILKANIDTASNLANKYMVRSLPTIVILKNNIIQDTKIGVSTKVDFVKFINSNL